MIFIVVRFTVKPEHRDTWLEALAPFTEATRAEPGNLWFDWSRSVDRPAEFVLVEAFEDGEAPTAHVASEHFRSAMTVMPPLLATTPEIVNVRCRGPRGRSCGS